MIPTFSAGSDIRFGFEVMALGVAGLILIVAGALILAAFLFLAWRQILNFYFPHSEAARQANELYDAITGPREDSTP